MKEQTSFELTPGQQDLVIGEMFRPEHRSHSSLTYRITGPLDVEAFDRALHDVIGRHEALRLRIGVGADGRPRQHAAAGTPNVLACQAIRARSAEQFENYAIAAFHSDRTTPWDLAELPPVKARLLRFSPELHAFGAVFADLAFDGTSRAIFDHDLWSSYRRRTSGTQSPVPAAPGFLAALAGRRAKEVAHDHVRAIATRMPVLCQFGGTNDAAASEQDSHRVVVELGADALAAAQTRSRELKCSLFQLVLAAFTHAVFGQCVQDRIAVYVPTDTRRQSEGDVVGMFTESTLLVLDRAGLTAVERVAQVRRAVLSAMMSRHSAPEVVREAIFARGQAVGAPVRLNLMATWAEVAEEQDGAGELVVTRDAYAPTSSTSTGISLRVLAFADKLRLVFDCNTALLPPAESARLVQHVEEVLSDPSAVGVPVRRPAGLTPLHDENGDVDLVVDVEAITELLRSHPGVSAVDVTVNSSPGEPALRAAVTTTAPGVTASELREHCYRAARDSVFVVSPHVEVTGPEPETPSAMRDRLLGLLCDALPGAGPDDRFWLCGGSFAVLRALRERAGAEGLPALDYQDFVSELTLRGIADRVARRADHD